MSGEKCGCRGSPRLVWAVVALASAASFLAGAHACGIMDGGAQPAPVYVLPDGFRDGGAGGGGRAGAHDAAPPGAAWDGTDHAGPDSVSVDDDPAKGDPRAPVTIVEFSDFECPFCLRFYEETLPLIEARYVDTGKASFVYRDFPLGFHQSALPAHVAAECADEQGAFWEYHDALFEAQAEWASAGPGLRAALVGYAAALGLDAGEFSSCLDDPGMEAEVMADYSDGSEYGITGTPGFLVGSDGAGWEIVSGAQPFWVFERAIESRLAG